MDPVVETNWINVEMWDEKSNEKLDRGVVVTSV
jgi:hypothetical protein